MTAALAALRRPARGRRLRATSAAVAAALGLICVAVADAQPPSHHAVPAAVPAAASAGAVCSPLPLALAGVTGPEVPGTPSRCSLRFGGLDRTYNVYRPAQATLAAAPLVLVLHGINMTAEQMEVTTHFDLEAQQSGFIVVYPQGWHNSWNIDTYPLFGDAGKARVNDAGFLNQVITEASRKYLVNPKRIYVTGFSNGAFMSYDMACRYPQRLAAIAPVAGLDLAMCRPKSTVSVIDIHGLADSVVPFQPFGRTGVTRWRATDRCGRNRVDYIAPVHSERSSGCTKSTAVDLYMIDGMNHIWPSMLDPLSPRGVDASSMIWTFFDAHPRP
jgi:polyhydroxybutyrate depolymerase